MKFPKNYSKRSAPKSAAKYAPKAKAKSTAYKTNSIKKVVDSVLKQKNELKIVQNLTLAENIQVSGTGLLYDGVTNLRGWSSGPAQPAGLIPVCPNGTGEGQKIGNKITPKNLIVKYIMSALPTTDSSFTGGNTNPFKGVPFRVRVIVYRHKYAIDDFTQTNILQNGNSTTSWGSGIDNFFRPYNKDEYTIVYSKTVKMAACKHVSGATGTTITTENVPNGALSFYQASAKIPLPSVLRYNDGADVPTNAGYYMAVVYCNEDGSADSAGAYKRLLLNAEAQLTYYDN